MIEVVGNPRFGPVRLLCLNRFEDWPTRLDPPSENLVVLLVCDARAMPDHAIRDAARTALGCGLAYVCTWGPGCERVHDLFDGEIVDIGVETGDRVVPTTWHENDSLEAAVWFFLHGAWPPAHEHSRSLLAAVVGDPDLARRVRRALETVTDDPPGDQDESGR